MLPFKIVYGEQCILPMGTHVFPADKYRKIAERILQSHLAESSDFVEPVRASDEDVLLVHTPLYVEKLKKGMLSTREELELEVPYSPELVEAFYVMTGGSILAAEIALREGICIHLGGGFHHAFPDHGEGFCMLHDVAVAIRKMQRQGRIAKAMVVDCDVHQGNGTAAIFGSGEPEPFPKPAWSASMFAPRRPAHMKTGDNGNVFTISLHQENNYPSWKPASSIDVNLPDGTRDEEYLHWLGQALASARERFDAELLCYIAGADPYVEDQLGGLALSIDGLAQRDRMVLQFARDHGIPVMVTMAGGYADRVEDTVTIHANTVAEAAAIFR